MGEVTAAFILRRYEERRKITPLMRKLHRLGWDTALYHAGATYVFSTKDDEAPIAGIDHPEHKCLRSRGCLIAFGQHTPLKLVISYVDNAPVARIHHPADFENWSIKDFKTIDECLAFLAEHSDTELYDPHKRPAWPWQSTQACPWQNPYQLPVSPVFDIL